MSLSVIATIGSGSPNSEDFNLWLICHLSKKGGRLNLVTVVPNAGSLQMPVQCPEEGHFLVDGAQGVIALSLRMGLP